MKVTATALADVLVIEPQVFADDRGWFVETFRRERYEHAGIHGDFVQDNWSHSRRGVVRGLHYQLAQPQGKLVRVTRGEILDVAVDIRRGSPTFGRHVALRIGAADHRQLWIPPGFAHGFAALSDVAEVAYKTTAAYDRGDDHAIRWNDPALGIDWGAVRAPLLSARDASAPLLGEAVLPEYRP